MRDDVLVLQNTPHHSGERRSTECPYCRCFVYADEHKTGECRATIVRQRDKAQREVDFWNLRYSSLAATTYQRSSASRDAEAEPQDDQEGLR